MNRLMRRACSALLVIAALSCAAPSRTCAQDGVGKARTHVRAKKKRARVKPPRAEEKAPRERAPTRGRTRERGVSPAATATAPAATPTSGTGRSAAAVAAAQAAAGVDAEIVKEGDTSVKVMKFTGLGIEGRLKSPQLVYFVQRVRAEFERPTLAHRSFMPELASSTMREPTR